MSATATKMGIESAKTGRQCKATEKTRYEFMLDVRNYNYLYGEAKERGISISALLNIIVSGMRKQSS